MNREKQWLADGSVQMNDLSVKPAGQLRVHFKRYINSVLCSIPARYKRFPLFSVGIIRCVADFLNQERLD